MSLFKGPMRQHIPGHKELSDHVDIMEVKAGSKVFIPLICGPSVNLEILVKEGDHVPLVQKLPSAMNVMLFLFLQVFPVLWQVRRSLCILP